MRVSKIRSENAGLATGHKRSRTPRTKSETHPSCFCSLSNIVLTGYGICGLTPRTVDIQSAREQPDTTGPATTTARWVHTAQKTGYKAGELPASWPSAHENKARRAAFPSDTSTTGRPVKASQRQGGRRRTFGSDVGRALL
ncbi:hypothetical protein MHYP_G00073790 [Metynnis hypsauchen]